MCDGINAYWTPQDDGTFISQDGKICTLDEMIGELIIDAYRSKLNFIKIMSRPGVTITPEQEATIRQFVADGEIAKAQDIILDQLEKDNPHD